MSLPGSPSTRMRPIGPLSPMRKVGRPRSRLAGGQSPRSGRWPSRVCTTRMPCPRAHASRSFTVGTIAARRLTSLPSASPKPPRSMKSRCMSITTSAVPAGANVYAYGRAAISGTGGGEHRRRVMAGHRGADDADVGLLGRGLVDDAAAEDHRDAVGELEQLVEILADQ